MPDKKMRILASGKTPFNWNVDPELRTKFDEICAARGYQMQAQVEKMLRDWIQAEAPPGEAPAGQNQTSGRTDKRSEGSGGPHVHRMQEREKKRKPA
jgi:hypothetical protein